MRPRTEGVLYYRAIIFFMVSISIFSHAMASAHGIGKSIERVMGDYLIDIGYDPDPLRAGENSVFDFVLKGSADKKEIPFTHVWVRLERGEGIVLAVGLKKADLGKTSLLYNFPEAGEYQLTARFQDNDKTLVEATVPVIVAPSIVEATQPAFPASFLEIGGAFLLGALMGVVAVRLGKNRAPQVS